MRTRTAVAALAALLSAHAASADQVVLAASADNTVFSESVDLSNGSGDYFFSGRVNGPELRRALVKFDVAAAIPPGSTIDSVSLTLYMSRSKKGSDTVSLHLVLDDWGEGASDAELEEGAGIQAQQNDATWGYRFYNAAAPATSPAWASAGGDFMSPASASSLIGDAGGFYTWATTADLVDDVQAWLDAPSSNFGWLLLGNEATTRTSARFNSRTNPDAPTRPALTIEFTPPAGTGACCFGDGNCQILSASDCSLAGGSFQGEGTACSPNPCPQPTGACCLPDGSCVTDTEGNCIASGGIYQGDDVDCGSVTCVPITGATCFNDGSCMELTEADALAMGGVYQGDFTLCGDTDCPVILEPFVDELTVPPVAVPTTGTIGGVATYDIDIVQSIQKLHRDLPPTTLWTYNGTFPGPTIVATSGLPVTVNYTNDLRDDSNQLRTDHYLDVDLCPHGSQNLPKTVTHLHGAHLPAIYDGHPEETVLPGESFTYHYPNLQPSALLWYHDHALGITRLNVYMGMAAGYIIRDSNELSLGLPSGEYEVPLIIQDRSFNPDGSLKYPSVWQPMYFGDTMLVNGTVWPYMEVKQAKYRFRALNGCGSRTLTLGLSNGASFDVISSEGGLLAAPVTKTEMTLGNAERADLLIDFSAYAPGTEIVLTNSGPAPNPNANPNFAIPEIMKFIVTADSGPAPATPQALNTITPLDENDADVSRDFVLRKGVDPHGCASEIWLINDMMWSDVTEQPNLGDTEVWSFINRSGMMHPMHMHLVLFQVLDRQFFDVVNDQVVPIGTPTPPPPEEAGWKDTVRVNPNEIVRVIARFDDFPGLFSYHCHILEHEDHEMMRQFNTRSCPGDFTTTNTNPGDVDYGRVDGITDGADLSFFIEQWLAGKLSLADVTTTNTNPGDPGYGVPDGTVDGADLSYFVEQWLTGCP